MATGGEVLEMLCPEAKFAIYGDDYDSINWFDEAPAIDKTQFEQGFAQFDSWKLEQDQKIQLAKENAQAKLAALGLTVDDLEALGL
jgi:hypothetical protein